MPYSSPTFDLLCMHIISHVSPNSLLDVGCGAGKYADIARRAYSESLIVGYEEEPSYIERFQLKEKYDEIHNASIEDVIRSVGREFDLCIFGDVLEHMPKSIGQDVIHFLLYRSKCILLVVPFQYLQNDECGVLSEAHISSWHPKEFELFTDTIFVSKAGSWLAILRGFLCDPLDFALLREAVQGLEMGAKYLPCRGI